MDLSGCIDDASFGPIVHGCRHDFDFTLKFELLFFSIIPVSIFIALSFPRIVFLAENCVVNLGSWFKSVKLILIFSYAAIHLSLLVLSSVESTRFRLASLFIVTESLSLAAAFCMAILSHFEHTRSLRPSLLLSAYLCFSLLFDIAQSRTIWLAAASRMDLAFARVFTVSVTIKAAMILLESRQKSPWLVNNDKRHSPEEMAGLYGLGTFMWLNRLFLNGYKKVLDLDDMFILDADMTVERLLVRFSKHAKLKLRGQKHALVGILAKTLAVPLLLPVGPRIALTGFTFCQTFLIQAVLEYMEKRADESSNLGYGLIGATFLIYSGIAISTSFYWYFHERFLYMARGCLSAAIFKKTTESKLSVVGKSSAITLMSTDIERILKGLLNLHEFWANLVEVALASWLLKRKLGIAFIAPIGLVLVSVIFITILGKFIGSRQRAWMEQIQKRVGLTANAISIMKHIKISGLAAAVEESIQALRLHELRVARAFRRLQIVALFLAFFPNLIAPPITFAATSRTLDGPTIFTSTAYLTLLTIPLTDVFRSVAPLMSALACLGRIQTFLEDEPRIDFRVLVDLGTLEKAPVEPFKPVPAISVVDGNFGWKEGQYCLRNINLTFPHSQLTMVVGPVASGKSTLCKTLLGEIPISRGHVIMGCNVDRIGYCDQIPFLSNKTIKDNIVGFSSYNSARYSEVLEASMLVQDLSLLPRGDDTLVGTNGITLSGGQKQRVSIARALYLQSNILICDDVLSGLDAYTEQQLFDRIFGPEGILKRRFTTVILCTHSIKHLPSADHIVALGVDGEVIEEGRFDTLATSNNYVQSLGVEASDETSLPDYTPNNKFDSRKQVKDTPTPTQGSASDLTRKKGDVTVYRHYFKSISALPLIAFTSSNLAYGFFYNFPTIWIKYWSTDVTSPSPSRSKTFWALLFALFKLLALFCSTLTTFLGLNYMALLSGAALHLSALRTVTRALLSFFTTTDLGMVANHFSQDMTLIDGELPASIINLSIDLAVTIGMAAVLATSSPYLVIAYPFILILMYIVQKFYLSTSRQIRLLDLEAKSPLYAHFLDIGRGISTIRAFGWTEDNITYNNQLLDISQRPAYLLAMIQRWLLFVLNVFVLILAVLAVTLSTQLQTNTGFTGSGMLTLMQLGQYMTSVVQCYAKLETSMGAVSRLKSFSENTKTETLEGEAVIPPPSWPPRGRVEVNGVSASYDENPDNLALKDLKFNIKPGQKVAICGRTGSGKSSIILLLLRLLDPLPSTSQNINIDGLALHQIDRSILRQRIIAVPQDAIFLPDGTPFKENLDPFALSSEVECESILKDVNLWELVQAHGGLSAGMSPDTLSQGQKQLFSLARAILRKRFKPRELTETEVSMAENKIELKKQSGGILMLDEVTSNVDFETEREMHEIIQREFDGFTVIMVSHRLDVVIEFDRVIILDSGSVLEDGMPKELVKKEQGKFRELWMAANKEQWSKSE